MADVSQLQPTLETTSDGPAARGDEADATAVKKQRPVLREQAKQALQASCTAADSDAPQFHGWTIWEAAKNGKLDGMLPLILSDGNAVHMEEPVTRATALHYAAGSGATACIGTLLQHGAVINKEDANGWTPLAWACVNSQTDTAVRLVKSGACMLSAGRDGLTPLHHATVHSITFHCLLRLLHKLAEDHPQHVSASDVEKIHVALFLHAAGNNRYNTVLYCLEQLAVPVDSVDEAKGDGQTALHLAFKAGHEAVVGLLASRGADGLAVNAAGETPGDQVLERGAAAKKGRLLVALKAMAAPGRPVASNFEMLIERENLATAAAACFLPNAFLLLAAMLPPVLGFVALGLNLSLVFFITSRAMHKKKPDPGLAGWYFGGLIFGSGVLTVTVFPHVGDSLTHGIWYVITSLMFFFYVKTLLSDPGTVQSTVKDRQDLYESVSESGMVDVTLFCPTSLVRKPFRSKFCSTTLRPVHRFDHYCVWTCNAIGGGNVRSFVTFSTLQLLSQAGVSLFTATHLSRQPDRPSASALYREGPCVIFDFFFSEKLVVISFVLVIYNLAVFVFILTVFFTQFWYIGRNVTSNEVWFSDRYSWCFTLGTRVYTLYDKGWVANWKEFLFGNLVAYDSTLPVMDHGLAQRVARFNQWKAAKTDRMQRMAQGMNPSHPMFQGAAISPAASGNALLEAAGKSTMMTDAETGLMMPSHLSTYLSALPAEKRKVLAAVQQKQFRDLGLLASDGTLKLPDDRHEQEAIFATIAEKIRATHMPQQQQQAARCCDQPHPQPAAAPVVSMVAGGSRSHSHGHHAHDKSAESESSEPPRPATVISAPSGSSSHLRSRSQPAAKQD